MSRPARIPLVCITANRQDAAHHRNKVHATGERNTIALARMVRCVPLLLPPLGADLDVAELVARIDGLVLTGGRANVEPHHYGGPPFPPDEPVDPGRDAAVLPLVRACLDAGVPLFGICRGIQEINVALGGTLHYRIHELDGKLDHRMPRRDDVTVEEIFCLRHTAFLTDGGLFERLAGTRQVQVNSLHGQGIDRLAEGLEVEAVAEDGVIEGVRVAGAPTFAAGVQWHAEWKPEQHRLSGALYRAFGEAACERAQLRGG